ncbi:MAG: 50S ribosomal protein L24 [Candidatus Komeilibacteria bacterium]|nr:50S ribosomal protein L24 [Candidatus Komeilibacteria bacterium]
MKIKKNDLVQIISGKDKGKRGKVLQVFPATSQVLVEGTNLHWRHTKPRKQGEKGQRLQVPGRLPVSKVMAIDPHSNLPSRLGFKKTAAGVKVRIAKKSGEVM